MKPAGPYANLLPGSGKSLLDFLEGSAPKREDSAVIRDLPCNTPYIISLITKEDNPCPGGFGLRGYWPGKPVDRAHPGPQTYFERQIFLPWAAIIGQLPESGTGGKFFLLTVFFLRDVIVKFFRIFSSNAYYGVAWMALTQKDFPLKAQPVMGHILGPLVMEGGSAPVCRVSARPPRIFHSRSTL